MNKTCFLLAGLIVGLLFPMAGTPMAADSDRINIDGSVTYKGEPVCAMVLANGQYAFTCSADGSFNLDVPLDQNNQITVQAFCSGRAPYRQTITPSQGNNLSIVLEDIKDGGSLDVAATLQAISNTRVRLSGTVSRNGSSVCAMVLANGQYAFTCSGDGSFSLELPLDTNGSATLFAFCSNLQPYKTTFAADQIDFDQDNDQDGYTISGGDCNDLDADRHPGATETCGDGIDQDCDGHDLSCESANATSFSPITKRDSTGNLVPLNWLYRVNNGTMQIDVEGLPLNFNFSNIQLSINPNTLIRQGNLSGTISGVASGNFSAAFIENLSSFNGKTLVDAQDVEIDLTLTAEGESVGIAIDVNTDWYTPVEWFLDRNDLDQLPINFTYDETGFISGNAYAEVKITGDYRFSNSFSSAISSAEKWKITGHLSTMIVNGTWYHDIVEVTRYTVVPEYVNGSIQEKDAQIIYWVARGIGMLKSIGHFTFLGRPLTVELVSTNLKQ